jgi:uncharacterized protein YbcI
VAAVLDGDTLAVTLHGALTPAEQAAVHTPQGAAGLQELYRQLFASAWEPLRREVERLAGVAVREASAEIQGATGAVAFVFLLAGTVPAETWSGSDPGG